MERQNCWDYTKCRRQAECPAYPDHGRTCFAVTGTWCRGEKQASYEAKIERCRSLCGFYKDMMGITAWERIDRAVND